MKTRSVSKIRLDQLLVERGIAESRQKAQRLIIGGRVYSGDTILDKPGRMVMSNIELKVVDDLRYVSRGGIKLENALKFFGIKVEGRICLDIGASTGGFTDCLVQHGAKLIYAVDVGTNQLHWKIRKDPRVIVMERINARYLTVDMFDPLLRPDLCTVDVSFISLKKIIPSLVKVVVDKADILLLIKPQFEAGRKYVSKGVVKDETVRWRVISDIGRFCAFENNLNVLGVNESGLTGPAGNVEFFMYVKKEAVL